MTDGSFKYHSRHQRMTNKKWIGKLEKAKRLKELGKTRQLQITKAQVKLRAGHRHKGTQAMHACQQGGSKKAWVDRYKGKDTFTLMCVVCMNNIK